MSRYTASVLSHDKALPVGGVSHFGGHSGGGEIPEILSLQLRITTEPEFKEFHGRTHYLFIHEKTIRARFAERFIKKKGD